MRFVFKLDAEGNRYLIPLDRSEEFHSLLENASTKEEVDLFVEKFQDMLCLDFTDYSFSDPKIE